MGRMEQIRELQARLAELTSEELATLHRLVGEEIAELREAETTAETVAAIRTVVEISHEVTAEDDRRTEEATRLQSDRDALLAEIDGQAGGGEGGQEGAEGEQGGEQQTAEGEGAEQGEGAEGQQEAVAASGRPRPQPRRAALRSIPGSTGTSSREAEGSDGDGGAIAIVASADGRRSGPRMTGHDLAVAVGDRIQQLRRTLGGGTDGDQLLVAGATYGDRFGDRTFTDDATANTRILERIAAEARGLLGRSDRDTVLASGGVCAVYPVDYTYDTIGVQDRPVRDSLPSGTAPRGGIQFYPPPVYDKTLYPLGVTQWTSTQDIAVDPSDDSTWKPCIEFDCGTPTTAELYAVPQCAEISNLRQRFNPENVEANLYYLGVAHSSVADNLLLQAMINKCRFVQEGGQVSATRDILSYIDITLASLRDQYRLAINQAMHVWLPHWARELIRIDMARAAFPDDLGISRFAITDAQITSWFTARGCAVTWLLDAAASDQVLTAQAVGSLGSPQSLNNLPNVVRWMIAPEGTFTYLDGGELNMGVTRDANLNRRNRFQMFMETFEGLVMRGVQAQWHKSTIVPNGASVGTIAPASWTSTL